MSSSTLGSSWGPHCSSNGPSKGGTPDMAGGNSGSSGAQLRPYLLTAFSLSTAMSLSKALRTCRYQRPYMQAHHGLHAHKACLRQH